MKQKINPVFVGYVLYDKKVLNKKVASTGKIMYNVKWICN